jgi:enoyl-CoA hydratase/carnithine racemase
MPEPPVRFDLDDHVATITLNDPARRNAMTVAMFDGLDEALGRSREDESVRAVLLQGEGSVFCAGFDLGAAADDPALLATYIERLSHLVRTLRRQPAPVVAAVQGAAIAGGCAACSACDFVVASRTARFGYPVHPIGVSPALTIPTLQQKLAPGGARAVLMGGELLDAPRAHRLGLVSRLSESDETVRPDAMTLARDLAAKPPHALRVTKAWLNELDGSTEDGPFDGPRDASARSAIEDESVALLRAFWESRCRR